MNRRRHAMALAVAIAASVSLRASMATATPANIHVWNAELADSCEAAALDMEGDPLFSVNTTPIPTYTIPNTLVQNGLDGSSAIQWTAPFDSILMQPGANAFAFGVGISTGTDYCVHAHELVKLESPLVGVKPLFDFFRVGKSFTGTTSVSLALAEVNPPLARDLENLKAAIAKARQGLIDNASKVTDLAARQSALQALDTELTDLVKRPLDDISQVDLDAILAKYASVVDAGTKAALEQLLNDVKKSVVTLQNELTTLLNEFAAQAKDAANYVVPVAESDDPANYVLGAGDVPGVDVPDVSSVSGAFNPGNDPYAKYADSVIAKLDSDVLGGVVTSRADFVATVRAWRTNEAALQKALQQRTGVSQAETSAFLNGQNRVTASVRRYMDAADWFNDASASPYLRALVDGALRQQWDELATRVKIDLNLWNPGPQPAFAQALSDTLGATIAGIQSIGQAATVGANEYAAVAQIELTIARVGVGFVPLVGDSLDVCEALSGKEWCVPGGRDLTDGERVFAAASVVIGSPSFWKGAKNGAVGTASLIFDDAIRLADEEIVHGVRIARVESYRGIRGSMVIDAINDANKFQVKFELAVAANAQKSNRRLLLVGDKAVRKWFKIPDDKRVADMVSIVSDGRFAITEIKGVTVGSTETSKAIEQLTNVANAFQANNLGGEIAILELAIPTGGQIGEGFAKQGDLLVKVINGQAPQVVKINGMVVHVVEVAAPAL